MNLSEQICSWITETIFDDLTASAVLDVKRAFWDTTGVMLAGANEPVSVKVFEYIKKDRAQGGKATVFTKECKFSPASAAVVNATMAHSLDFDDANLPTKCHSSAVLVPAILAVGEVLDSSGKDLITAYIVGLEVMTKLSALLGPSHYDSGWHSTATLGAFGATAAALKLYGPSKQQAAHALGITASRSSGLRKNFGTMAKSLHCGLAAEIGITSALMARQGFTADNNIFEGDLGFIKLFGKQKAATNIDYVFDEPSKILSCNLHIKRYPCCLGTHRGADAVLDYLLNDSSFNPSDITEINCIGSKGSFMALIHDKPVTGLEGKFSIQYVLAASLIDRKIDIDSFTDTMVQRPQIKELISKIKKFEELTFFEKGTEGGGKKFTTVRIKFKTGKIVEKRIDDVKGSPEDPLSDEQLMTKYQYCTKKLLMKEQIENSAAIFNSMEDLDRISELIKLFRQ